MHVHSHIHSFGIWLFHVQLANYVRLNLVVLDFGILLSIDSHFARVQVAAVVAWTIQM